MITDMALDVKRGLEQNGYRMAEPVLNFVLDLEPGWQQIYVENQPRHADVATRQLVTVITRKMSCQTIQFLTLPLDGRTPGIILQAGGVIIRAEAARPEIFQWRYSVLIRPFSVSV